MLPALWTRLLVDVFAEEVVLLDGGQRVMHVRAADHAELEGVDAQLLLMGEPLHQSASQVRIRPHLRRFGLVLHGQVAVLPSGDTEVRKLVIG